VLAMSKSRSSVVRRMEDKENVAHTSPVGECVRVVLAVGHDEISTFTKLYEETGWYIAEYESRDGGLPDQFIVAPGGWSDE